MKTIAVVQIALLIIISGAGVGMLVYTDVYDEILACTSSYTSVKKSIPPKDPENRINAVI